MSSKNNVFSLSGIYGTGRNRNPWKGSTGNQIPDGTIEGVFILKYDTQKDSVLFKGFVPFDKGIINDNWINRNSRRTKINSRNRNRDSYRYKIRDVFTLDDGSICGSIEQYFILERSSYDSRTGLSSSVYYYYYDDIIAFKIGDKNEFDWQKRIPKSQISTNDGGPFSSYSSFTDGVNLYFIFNDNLKNYNEEGTYSRGNNSCYSFNLSRRKNVAAICQLSLENGIVERKTLFTRKELRSIVVPKMFKLDEPNKELLMYSLMSGKERFGVLKFNQK